MKPAGSLSSALFLLISVLYAFQSIAADSTRGKIVGGVAHSAPSWFKESFLEIADDVDEATANGKHVLLFFQLNDCPYCDRMLEETFEAELLISFIQKNFDSIAINVRGDREIVYNEEISVTEKELSEILDVTATPAIVFLDESNKAVVRVNGYRAPERFKQVLEFVASMAYQSTSLSEYMQDKMKRDVYQLRDNPMFTEVTDLSAIKGPLMVIMEDGSCYDCNEFHDGILAHPLVSEEIKPFTIVRLDADSNSEMIGVDGRPTTPKNMAEEYEMNYRPGVLAFNESKLIMRHDSLIFPHHFKESMRYVAGGFYKQSDFQTYSDNRTEELLSQGVIIDLGRPKTQ